jgi:hypothetical protein
MSKDLIMSRFYAHSLAELPQAYKSIMELPEGLGTEREAQNRHDGYPFCLLRHQNRQTAGSHVLNPVTMCRKVLRVAQMYWWSLVDWTDLLMLDQASSLQKSRRGNT